MNLKIDDLLKIQSDLDTRIFELHNTSREKTRMDRILALLVEVGELANETRVFKYWSLKPPSDKMVIFEEFSDVLHFTLSLGLDINYSQDTITFTVSDASLNMLFHEMYAAIHGFSASNSLVDYEKMLLIMCQIADAIGMTPESMRDMYLFKNEKNHKRQDEKY